MEKINLMQIVPSLESGGVEQGTLDVANHIAKLETENCVLSNGGSMLSYLNKKYVTHYKLPVHSKNFLRMPFLAKKINKIIEDKNINILHIRSRAPAWLIPYINKKKLKTVSTFHNVYGHENIMKKFYNSALSKTDHIVAISKYVSEEIIRNYKINPEKIKVINRGIDLNFYDGKINNEKTFMNFLEKNYISSNNKIILYPGRLTEWKGQIQFLNVIEKLKDKPYNFYFVGDNKNVNYEKRLLKEIKKKNLGNNCKLLGHLDKENLKMMYYCSDLVISMPLKPEGFGRIISETIAMKKIIIAKNIGGVKNQLECLDDIYKINTNQNEEIANKINSILETPFENFEKLKSKSREYIVNNFSKEQMLDNYVDLYRNILN